MYQLVPPNGLKLLNCSLEQATPIKTLLTYSLERTKRKIQTRHQSDAFAPRRDGSIDNKGERLGGWKAQYSSRQYVFAFEIREPEM